MRMLTDAIGRQVEIVEKPEKIISLDPAITETLFDLGCDESIVGRTRFCIHPKDKVDQALNVGGTKTIKLDRIHQLNPDLIIVEKEENTKEIVETLEAFYPVYVFEIQTVEAGKEMVKTLGDLVGVNDAAEAMHQEIEAAFASLPKISPYRMAYMIWKKPYMAAGRDTYIDHMFEKLGFVNPMTALEGRYPEVTAEDLKAAQLDILFLASEPYPFSDKHHPEFHEILPDVKIINIDGEMFWYGSRMLKAIPYFQKIMTSETLKG